MKRKVSAILTISALLSLFLLQSLPVAAQNTGSVLAVNAAELEGLTGDDDFNDLEATEAFSDEAGAGPGVDLTDAFGVVFVVIDDNDREANILTNETDDATDALVLTNLTGSWTADPPLQIVDANGDGNLTSADITLRVNGGIREDIVSVEADGDFITLDGPFPNTSLGDTVELTYKSSVSNCLIENDGDGPRNCEVDDEDEESLVNVSSDSDGSGIAVVAQEVAIIDIDAADPTASAAVSSGVFVGKFGLIPNNFKDAIEVHLLIAGNEVDSVDDLRTAVLDVADATFGINETEGTAGFSAADQTALHVLLGGAAPNLEIPDETAAKSAQDLMDILLGVNDGDDVAITYRDLDPSADRVATFVADLSDPVVDGFDIADGSFTDDDQFFVNFNIGDSGSGFATDITDSVTVSLANVDAPGVSTFSDFCTDESNCRIRVLIDAETTADADAGLGNTTTVTITATITDAVGNSTEAEIDIIIDLVEPTLEDVFTGWAVEADEDGVYWLVQNDDEWLVLVFDDVVDGDTLEPVEVAVTGHTVQEIVWLDEVSTEADDFGGDASNLADDLTAMGLLDDDEDQDAQHLIFVQVEAGSLSTGETPTIEIDNSDIEDLATNNPVADLEEVAEDRLWPVLTIRVTNVLSNSGLEATVESSEALGATPVVTATLGVTDYALDLDQTDDSTVWSIDMDLDDIGIGDDGADDGVYAIVGTASDASGNENDSAGEATEVEIDTVANDDSDPVELTGDELETDAVIFIAVDFEAEGAEYTDDSKDDIAVTSANLETLDSDGDVTAIVAVDAAAIQTSNSERYVIALNDLAQGDYNLEINYSDVVGNAGTHVYDFEVIAPQPVAIEVDPGWTLISIPGSPVSSAIADVVEGTAIEQVWSFNNETKIWEFARENPESPGVWEGTLIDMRDGRAYFVRSTTFDPIEVLLRRFSPQRVPPQYSITQGWNGIGYTVGGQQETVNTVDAYLSSLSGGWGVIRWWNPEELQYESAWSDGRCTDGFPSLSGEDCDADIAADAPAVMRGQGYLLFATSNGTLAP